MYILGQHALMHNNILIFNQFLADISAYVHHPTNIPGISPSDEFAIASNINNRFLSVAEDLEPIDVKMLPAYLPTDIHVPCPTLAPWTVHKALTGIRLTSTYFVRPLTRAL